MPERGPQFDYPEKGWSTGKMRMAKAGPRGMDPGREYRELEGERKKRESKVSQNEPMMTTEEWRQWLEGPAERDRLRYMKDNRLDNVLQDHPEGFIVDKDHPGLEGLRNTHDLLKLPSEADYNDSYFARPKPKEGAPVAQGPGPQWSTG